MARSSQRVLAFLARFGPPHPEPAKEHAPQSSAIAEALPQLGSLEEWHEYSNRSAEEARRASASYPLLSTDLSGWKSAHNSLPAHCGTRAATSSPAK